MIIPVEEKPLFTDNKSDEPLQVKEKLENRYNWTPTFITIASLISIIAIITTISNAVQSDNTTSTTPTKIIYHHDIIMIMMIAYIKTIKKVVTLIMTQIPTSTTIAVQRLEQQRNQA